MASINSVILIGRVVRDIEVKTTNSGNNAAPATERYAEDDAKAAKTTTSQAAKPVEDIDLDTSIDLSEIPF